MTQVVMTINDSVAEFNTKKQKWLISAISGFLGTSPGSIKIKVIKEYQRFIFDIFEIINLN